jgi:glycosyltransferase involved in cell wall biosynthesis
VADGAALLVPPGDVDALAGALEALLAGGPEVDRLRAAGPQVAAPYTWAASAAAHVNAYRRAAA